MAVIQSVAVAMDAAQVQPEQRGKVLEMKHRLCPRVASKAVRRLIKLMLPSQVVSSLGSTDFCTIVQR